VIALRRGDGRLWSLPIWVDFMNVDRNGCIPLDYPGTRRDLNLWGVELCAGMRIILYEGDADDSGQIDDLVAVGIVRFDADERRWVAESWEPTVHASELDQESRQLYDATRRGDGPVLAP
jgi:hypothetical protein